MSSVRMPDNEAIRNLYATYTYAVDDQDLTLFSTCFTPDVQMEIISAEFMHAIKGSSNAHLVNSDGWICGLANIRALLEMAPKDALTLHLSSNILIKSIKGNEAEAQAAFTVVGADGVVEQYGRYIDKVARSTDGNWQFKERRVIYRFWRQH